MATENGFSESGGLVLPLTWGRWKVMKEQVLKVLQEVLGDVLKDLDGLQTMAEREDVGAIADFILGRVQKLQGFEDLAVSLAVTPVTDDTPLHVAQTVRTEGAMQILEAIRRDADFLTAAGGMIGPLVAAAQQSTTNRSAGGPR